MTHLHCGSFLKFKPVKAYLSKFFNSIHEKLSLSFLFQKLLTTCTEDTNKEDYFRMQQKHTKEKKDLPEET